MATTLTKEAVAQPMTPTLRSQVRERAGGRCKYCQLPEELDALPFHWDHIIAQKHAGPTVLENLAWSCYSCNNRKQSDIAGIDPESGTDEIFRLWREVTWVLGAHGP